MHFSCDRSDTGRDRTANRAAKDDAMRRCAALFDAIGVEDR